ncbi:MAG: ABC transporter ATP-binding protein [Acutalibacteraceae bacterium]
MLYIDNLTKTYGKKKAVDGLSLHVMPGDIYGFIGLNGAGKTTTIKSCCGLLRFDSGEIYINGRSIKDEPLACKRDMAYIPDNPDLYDYMTGIRYLNFVGDIYKVPSGLRRELIKYYGELFGIFQNLSENMSSYSHGMKQKISIVAALLHNPKLLIMDEPFVGLDPIAAYNLKTVMKSLCMQGGAIFFSTHVLDVAEKLCNKIAIIKEGRILVAGNTAELVGDGSLENVFLELEGKNVQSFN